MATLKGIGRVLPGLGPVQEAVKPQATAASMEDLLEHQAWVRALARRLVRDPHLAEDLVQETWVAALERPAGSVRAMRAWLASVLRNLVRERARTDGSRRWREESSAREEATASTLELYAKVSAHRRVVESVTELPEHYREALLLRYFEGLPPTAIAERLGVPVSTVKTRLARGLAMMRERLDRAAGGDGESWLRGLAPLVAPALRDTGGATLGAGLVLKAAAWALVLLGLGWGLRDGWSRYVLPEPASVPVEGLARAMPEADEPATAQEVGGAPEEEREEVQPDGEAIAAAPEAPPDYPLRGRVQDLAGRPVAGVVLAFESSSRRSQATGPSIAVSDGEGAFEFGSARGAGRVKALREDLVTLFAGEVKWGEPGAEARVVVAPGSPLAGRVVDEDGRGVAEAEVAVLPPEGGFGARGEELTSSTLALPFTTTDETGAFDLGVAIEVPGARLEVRAEGFERYLAPRPEGATEALVLELSRPAASAEAWTGRVLDPAGVPLPGARVSLGGRTTRADEGGAFHFERDLVFVGTTPPQRVHAWHEGFGPASAELGADELVLRLAPEALAIRGRALDVAGEPVAGLDVYLADPTLFAFSSETQGNLRRSGPLRDDLVSRELRYELLEDLAADRGGLGLEWTSVKSDRDGRFELDGLDSRDYRIVLLRRGTLERLVTEPVEAGRDDLVVEFPGPVERRRVAGRLVDAAGRPVQGARVAGICNAFPVSMGGEVLVTTTVQSTPTRTDAEGRFDLGRLGLDSVHLEVWGEDVLRRELGARERPLADYADAELEELEIVVARRRRIVVELLEPSEADHIALVDAEGQPLPLLLETPGRQRRLESAPLHEGQSDLLVAPEGAAELLLLSDGEEVRRLPLVFAPEGVTRLRP